MEEQVERAIALGLEEICFAEHLDLDPAEYDSRLARPGHPRDGFLDEEHYDRVFHRCLERYGDRINLRQGIEVGELQRFRELGCDIIAAHDYDIVLGSIHSLYGASLSSPWPEVPPQADQVYLDYFTQLQRLALCDGFDVAAHLDIVKRHSVTHYGPFDPTPFREEIREILRTLIQRGKGLEINTSGLRQNPRESMPGLTILCWYRELGGEILTIGSDAHRPTHMGYKLDDARDLAIAAGFCYVTTFVKRKPVFHKLS